MPFPHASGALACFHGGRFDPRPVRTRLQNSARFLGTCPAGAASGRRRFALFRAAVLAIKATALRRLAPGEVDGLAAEDPQPGRRRTKKERNLRPPSCRSLTSNGPT